MEKSNPLLLTGIQVIKGQYFVIIDTENWGIHIVHNISFFSVFLIE